MALTTPPTRAIVSQAPLEPSRRNTPGSSCAKPVWGWAYESGPRQLAEDPVVGRQTDVRRANWE
eukprot:scaffold93796_cov31-Tisochrysis_lutea.AAC.1